MSVSNVMKQELFEIRENNSRKKIVRQDRVPVEPKSCFISFNQRSFEISNITPFGLALLVNINEIGFFDVSKDTSSIAASLEYKQYAFQDITFKPVRTEKYPLADDVFIVGCEIIGTPIDTDSLDALKQSRAVVLKHQENFARDKKIPDNFKFAILQLKDLLETLKEQINTLDSSIPTDNKDARDAYRSTLVLSIADFLGEIIPEFYSKLPEALKNYSEEEKALCVAFAREKVGPLVYGAPFAYRAYSKPRGYAGDYEMMNQLYRNDLAGATTFDKCMHKYFVDEPSGEAVKNRGRYLSAKIQNLVLESNKSHIKILSVASGPALEVQTFLANKTFPKGKTVEFHFIDQDEEALKHAQKEILSLERFVKSGYEFHFHNLAIKNILGRGIPNPGFDLIYSAGLFDYFTDPVANAAGQVFFKALNPNGVAIIGNFSKTNPNIPFMELVLDWHLIYRDDEDLTKLFGKISPECSIEREPLGINLFCVLKK